MNEFFESWKRAYNAWEKPTAELLETWVKSPLLLEPAGAMLTAMMKAKSAQDRLLAQCWGALGLPTKRDQERTLHALHQLESKLNDLEDRLAERP